MPRLHVVRVSCFSQEEYSNPDTLEHRLQLVAQRMVNHQGRNRGEQVKNAQDSTGTTVTTANGFTPPAASSAASTPNLDTAGQQMFSQHEQGLRVGQQGATSAGALPGGNSQANMLGQASAGFHAGPATPAYAMGATSLGNNTSMLGNSVKPEQNVPGMGMQANISNFPQYHKDLSPLVDLQQNLHIFSTSILQILL